jgi:hypothetical protein
VQVTAYHLLSQLSGELDPPACHDRICTDRDVDLGGSMEHVRLGGAERAEMNLRSRLMRQGLCERRRIFHHRLAVAIRLGNQD